MATTERLTIARFVEATKAHLLNRKRVVPSVTIRLSNGQTAAALIDPSWPKDARREAFGLAGTELAKRVFPKAPDLIIICYEGVMSHQLDRHPEEADDRRECVLFSTYEADPEKLLVRRSGLIYEVIRKGVLDLVHRPELCRTEERTLHQGFSGDIVDQLMSNFCGKFWAEHNRLGQAGAAHG